jgi:hypothetical protein
MSIRPTATLPITWDLPWCRRGRESPGGKGSGESHIGVLQRDFYQRVRDQVFYSLEELNTVLRRYLEHLTQEVMKDYGVSRAVRIEAEKQHLKPLPPTRFDVRDTSTPRPNYSLADACDFTA